MVYYAMLYYVLLYYTFLLYLAHKPNLSIFCNLGDSGNSPVENYPYYELQIHFTCNINPKSLLLFPLFIYTNLHAST